MVRFRALYDGAPDWLAMLEGLHQHSDNAMGHDDFSAPKGQGLPEGASSW